MRWLLWSGLVIAWTIALEVPVPEPESQSGSEEVITYKKIAGKTLHVAAYAFLAGLTGWLPVSARYRWLLMFFLMLHAWGTEMLQEQLYDICKRTGKLSDVGLDMLGIAIGLALSWKWWTRE